MRRHAQTRSLATDDRLEQGRSSARERAIQHERTLLGAAAEDGDVEIIGRSLLRLGTHLRAALDRNIAGRLLLLDRAHGMAMESFEANSLLSVRAAARPS